jgi:hypothetical protein
MVEGEQSMITEGQWIQEKLEEYKTDPSKVLKELFLNTNDTINQFFMAKGSDDSMNVMMTACILNNKLLAEIKKWDEMNPKKLLLNAEGRSIVN